MWRATPRPYRKSYWRRGLNALVRPLARLGLTGPRTHLLTVPGRRSGRPWSTPVSIVKEGDRRWLVFLGSAFFAAVVSAPASSPYIDAKLLTILSPAAVVAACSQEWSNVQVEGQVNRLKMLKRQMYGRANFDL